MQNKVKILLVLSLFFFFSETGAQNRQVEYGINFDFTLGPTKYFSGLDYDNFYDHSPLAATCRFMWEPEHLLRIGLESGYVPLYYLKTKLYDTVYGNTDARLSLNSVPVIAVFAMEVFKNFEIIGGIGGVILFSKVESFDNTVLNTTWSNVYEFGINYLYPLSEDLKIGAETKAYYILRLENFDVNFHFALKYTILKY